MTALAKTLPRVRNVTMAVREWEARWSSSTKVAAGAADRSYGIRWRASPDCPNASSAEPGRCWVCLKATLPGKPRPC